MQNLRTGGGKIGEEKEEKMSSVKSRSYLGGKKRQWGTGQELMNTDKQIYRFRWNLIFGNFSGKIPKLKQIKRVG